MSDTDAEPVPAGDPTDATIGGRDPTDATIGPGDPTDATIGAGDQGRIFACEFVGTAVLIMGGPGTAILASDAVGILGIAAAFGLSLAIMAYVIGPVSGCHINPAVTLGMLLTRKIEMRQAAFSWVAQVIGGIFGALVIFGIASGRDGWEREGFASNGWDRDGFSGLGASIIVEIVFTALLVAVVLSTTSRKFAPGFGGLIAGGTLFLIHLATIPVDNTGVNPARSLATAIFADTDPSALGQLWAFILFPLVGSVLGVFVWLLVDEAALEDTMLDHETLRTVRDKADDAID